MAATRDKTSESKRAARASLLAFIQQLREMDQRQKEEDNAEDEDKDVQRS